MTSDSQPVICHAKGDRCHGCPHYYGEADVCEYADSRESGGLDQILYELKLTADIDEDAIDGMGDLGKLCLRAVGMLRHQRQEIEALTQQRNEYREMHHQSSAGIERLLADNAALRAQVESLREALDFYAAPGTYQNDLPDPPVAELPYSAPIWSDTGERARRALQGEQGET